MEKKHQLSTLKRQGILKLHTSKRLTGAARICGFGRERGNEFFTEGNQGNEGLKESEPGIHTKSQQ
jgi:hypothetical protein